jgi:muramidase (phage lysozyme)
MSIERGIGSFMSGLAGGFGVANQWNKDAELVKLLKEKEAAALAAAQSQTPPAAPVPTTPAAPAAPTTPAAQAATTPAPAPAQSTPGQRVRFLDPVAADLPPHVRAFLNAISDGESGGKYNVRYTPGGGAEFSDLSRHPGIMEKGPEGPSSAAGRYQFTKTTWDSLGGGDFSPENQDRRAWQLAVSDYHKRTGRNLDEDLRTRGLTGDVFKALSPTWTSFRGNVDKHMKAFNDSLSRYSSATPKSIASEKTPSKKTGALDIMRDIIPEQRSILS